MLGASQLQRALFAEGAVFFWLASVPGPWLVSAAGSVLAGVIITLDAGDICPTKTESHKKTIRWTVSATLTVICHEHCVAAACTDSLLYCITAGSAGAVHPACLNSLLDCLSSAGPGDRLIVEQKQLHACSSLSRQLRFIGQARVHAVLVSEGSKC